VNQSWFAIRTYARGRKLAIVLLCVCTTCLWAGAQSLDSEGSSSENPPALVGRISYLKGTVSFLRAGLDQWSDAALNFPVTIGDRIYTGKGARAEVDAGHIIVRLSDNTDVTMTNLNEQVMQAGLGQGTLRVTVDQLFSGETVEVDTPNGAITFTKAGKCRVEADPNGDHTIVSVKRD
jgi:hypothetical protein